MPYLRASTANPTGWRPWNSRLSYYVENRFPVPTTGRGPFLLQPGAPCNRPAAAGGLSFYGPAQFCVPTSSLSRPLNGLADDSTDGSTQILGLSVDPTTLAIGVVALLAAVYLIGSKQPQRRARRLRKRISSSQAKLKALAV